MADKSVGELIAAKSVTPTDLFVLEQNGTAKKLTGQILENWLVSFADGHGGIQSIVKKSTSGLVDTYRITLADTTPFDFMVTNGKSIKSISKASTSGLVDTYRITFNDGPSSTFTVTNGEKGDKGDNQYVWIKYASKKPTVTSHSFGDVADDWIGIYSGSSDTAPTDWTQYEWFKIKGEKGDTGEPATLVSSSVTYQVGDSGTIIPSGSWSESIPPVAQGKYLWTKEVTKFNTGNPITKYSVSRFGIDGSGSVVTVNDVSPDENGNVELTSEQLQCLGLAGGTMTGPINMNGQAITGLNDPVEDADAVRKAYVDKNFVSIANNAGGHNAVYRGKNLGSSVTPEQWAAIKAGTFKDLFIGDYWVINGVNWRIAAFDYYLNTGDKLCTSHHAVIVPDTVLYAATMNDTDTNEGAYGGSKMRTSGLNQAKSTINSAFGAEHILQHRLILANACNGSTPTGISIYDSTVELMSERQLFGAPIWQTNQEGAVYTYEHSQFPLFALNRSLLRPNSGGYWLRETKGSSNFIVVINTASNQDTEATTSWGMVRPMFCIYQA